MTSDDLAGLIKQYRAGIDAELTLLHQLSSLSQEQRSVTHAGDLAHFTSVADSRDELMRSLVTIEEGLRDIRQHLADHRAIAARLAGYREVVQLHRDAAHLVGLILAADQASLSALADAELARRSAIASLERGETTLAAYRRVLSPPVAHATLLDRLG